MKKNLLKITVLAILLLIVAIGCNKDVSVTGVTLNKDNITLTVGATETLTATVLPHDATDKSVKWASNNEAVATVENGVVTANEVGEAIITVTTNDGNYTATCAVVVTPIIEPEPEWVEINGIKWAKRNVDAPGTFAVNPEDAGMFYQWNRKIGWSSADPLANHEGGTTWDNSIPTGDTWEKVNDPCPTGWRVPTLEELQSLVDAGSEWTTENGVNGRVFGSEDKLLFLPAAGLRSNTSGAVSSVGTRGYYWSSTYGNTTGAYTLLFYGTGVDTGGNNARAYGFSVRCVTE